MLITDQLKIEYLMLRDEWRTYDDELRQRGSGNKPGISFKEYIREYYSHPDKEMDAILCQLFDASYLDELPFGNWCMGCARRLPDNPEHDYCDSCRTSVDIAPGT